VLCGALRAKAVRRYGRPLAAHVGGGKVVHDMVMTTTAGGGVALAPCNRWPWPGERGHHVATGARSDPVLLGLPGELEAGWALACSILGGANTVPSGLTH
jgi:hypothetical protein